MALVEKGAAVCVEEHDLASGALTEQILRLLEAPDARADMGERIRGFACPDANQRIYEALMSIVRSK